MKCEYMPLVNSSKLGKFRLASLRSLVSLVLSIALLQSVALPLIHTHSHICTVSDSLDGHKLDCHKGEQASFSADDKSTECALCDLASRCLNNLALSSQVIALHLNTYSFKLAVFSFEILKSEQLFKLSRAPPKTLSIP